MATVTVTAPGDGQIRLTGDVPAESMLMLLTQAVELVRIQVVAKAVADLPPKVEIASVLPGSPNGIPSGTHGIRGGDMQFRKGTSGG